MRRVVTRPFHNLTVKTTGLVLGGGLFDEDEVWYPDAPGGEVVSYRLLRDEEEDPNDPPASSAVVIFNIIG